MWDSPTRLFHWCLVILIGSAYVTRTYLDDPTLYWHRMNGYAVLVLLLFRVIWGLVGSTTSRFASFVPTPGPTIRYIAALLRRRPLHYLGHNPLGSLLIFAMLIAVVVQASTGLFTSDETLAEGPLYARAPEGVSHLASFIHARGFWIILALAGLHVLANLIYQFGFKDRLITAMITGSKPAADYVDRGPKRFQPISRALISFAAAVAIVAGGVMAAGGSLMR